MIIAKATPEQFSAIRAFYFAVIDGLADAEYGPGWEKDIYPAVSLRKHFVTSPEGAGR